jgi:mRNA-degrading endonuclease RelE of RelBE toxin-antitoxin system
VISRTTERFRHALRDLPPEIQDQARTAYRRFQQDPMHPSLRFRQLHSTRPIYSARIGLQYRALGVRENETIVWFWIGSHAEYDRLVAQL